jgi:hypothetical protein
MNPMTENNNTQIVTTLSVRESIETIFLRELKSIIYDHKDSAYIKFINLAIGIEYLGACLDSHDFVKEGESKGRFDNALKKLFHKKYHKFSKSDNQFYLYEKFRCPFVHQLRPGKNVVVTHREESKREGTTHLEFTKSGLLVLVLEDFFDDFATACNNLFKLEEKNKLPSKKLGDNYIKLTSIKNNE